MRGTKTGFFRCPAHRGALRLATLGAQHIALFCRDLA